MTPTYLVPFGCKCFVLRIMLQVILSKISLTFLLLSNYFHGHYNPKIRCVAFTLLVFFLTVEFWEIEILPAQFPEVLPYRTRINNRNVTLNDMKVFDAFRAHSCYFLCMKSEFSALSSIRVIDIH